jgi:hypothetical protein
MLGSNWSTTKKAWFFLPSYLLFFVTFSECLLLNFVKPNPSETLPIIFGMTIVIAPVTFLIAIVFGYLLKKLGIIDLDIWS